MRYVAAYLLAHLGGIEKPSDKDLQKILSSVGIDVDDTLAKKVVSELQGKNLDELVAEGRKKLASLPTGGPATAAGAPTAAAAGKVEAVKEAPKEAPKEEEEEEEDGDMGFGLFD
ncbi:hypothetical protein HELRODRAFT_185711 [Helobdella robusta]|uniref:Large ribosomal subunit protein P2 n=1 Tax=Helobdella robusta TaxID=6412 RepID=T1FN66_HELRO|nr:hypothetical protein HELRODRAFT_185711 [Helobdella robusta]ESO01335.1 hypothetical protein HELRODRAFT_185711 [Helobdella robusta]